MTFKLFTIAIVLSLMSVLVPATQAPAEAHTGLTCHTHEAHYPRHYKRDTYAARAKIECPPSYSSFWDESHTQWHKSRVTVLARPFMSRGKWRIVKIAEQEPHRRPTINHVVKFKPLRGHWDYMTKSEWIGRGTLVIRGTHFKVGEADMTKAEFSTTRGITNY